MSDYDLSGSLSINPSRKLPSTADLEEMLSELIAEALFQETSKSGKYKLTDEETK